MAVRPPAFPHGRFLPQLVIAIYGGYFGGGIGIMMLATLAIAGKTDIHEMNGLKLMLAAAINGVALAEFVLHGVVAWTPGLLMAAGGIIGGYDGRIDSRAPARLRRHPPVRDRRRLGNDRVFLFIMESREVQSLAIVPPREGD